MCGVDQWLNLCVWLAMTMCECRLHSRHRSTNQPSNAVLWTITVSRIGRNNQKQRAHWLENKVYNFVVVGDGAGWCWLLLAVAGVAIGVSSFPFVLCFIQNGKRIDDVQDEDEGERGQKKEKKRNRSRGMLVANGFFGMLLHQFFVWFAVAVVTIIIIIINIMVMIMMTIIIIGMAWILNLSGDSHRQNRT